MEKTWWERYVEDLQTPRAAWSANGRVGLIDFLARMVLQVATLLSLHHILQATFHDRRFWATDLYFLAWAIFAAATALCSFGVGWCWAPGSWVYGLVIYRVVEALPRELWVVLYRGKPFTATSRVLGIAFLNYFTLIGLFGFLYQSGEAGYRTAAVISLTFSIPDEGSFGLLELIQAAYSFVFSAIIVAIFVSRVGGNGDSQRPR